MPSQKMMFPSVSLFRNHFVLLSRTSYSIQSAYNQHVRSNMDSPTGS
jgi:hypothetical protein